MAGNMVSSYIKKELTASLRNETAPVPASARLPSADVPSDIENFYFVSKGERRIMNTLVIVLIAAVCLIAAYTLYGRWLANKWGIDPKAKTPAVVHND